MYLMNRFAFFIGSFPNSVEGTVTILSAFHRTSAMFDLESTTTPYVSLNRFFILSTELKDKFSVPLALTLPVAAMPLDFSNRRRYTLVKKVSITHVKLNLGVQAI